MRLKNKLMKLFLCDTIDSEKDISYLKHLEDTKYYREKRFAIYDALPDIKLKGGEMSSMDHTKNK